LEVVGRMVILGCGRARARESDHQQNETYLENLCDPCSTSSVDQAYVDHSVAERLQNRLNWLSNKSQIPLILKANCLLRHICIAKKGSVEQQAHS
jgi:hypothetical protein